MKLSPCAFPHPVMNIWSEDEVAYNFDFNIRPVPSLTEWSLFYTVKTENPTLMQHIADGEAEYLIHVECNDRFYRACFSVSACIEEEELKIPATQLSGKVKVTAFICAKVDLPAYSNVAQHVDYRNATFQVEKGDYLAIGPTMSFIVSEDYDPLAQLSSFIKIVKSPIAKIDDPVKIDYAGPNVHIMLPPKLYQEYWDLKNRQGCAATISTVLILPVLVHLIAEMRREESEFSDHIWYQGIEGRFKKLGIDWQKTSESNYELAQRLLDTPVKRVAYELKAKED